MAGPFEPVGEFPWRVESGSLLAKSVQGLRLLAPLPGVVYYGEAEQRLQLRIEGSLQNDGAVEGKTPFETLQEKPDFHTLAELLEAGGLISCDFGGKNLASLLKQIEAHKNPRILMTGSGHCGAIDWRPFLATLQTEQDSLVKVLESICHVDRIYMHHKPDLKDRARNLPALLCRKIQPDFNVHCAAAEQGILFLGPETLLAILEYMFWGRPFVSRYVAVLWHKDMPGVPRTAYLSRVWNGESRAEMLDIEDHVLQRAAMVARHPARKYQSDGKELGEYYNIFEENVFYAFAPLDLKARNLACSRCGLCDTICPTNASPLKLVEGRSLNFLAEHCIECNLCSMVCESWIDFDPMIQSTINSRSSIAGVGHA